MWCCVSLTMEYPQLYVVASWKIDDDEYFAVVARNSMTTTVAMIVAALNWYDAVHSERCCYDDDRIHCAVMDVSVPTLISFVEVVMMLFDSLLL